VIPLKTEELQVPPEVPSVNVVPELMQTAEDPPIAAGGPLTVTVTVARQPVLSVYVIIDEPVAIPVTTPDVDPMLATAVLLLFQVPPGVASLSVLVLPMHRAVVPVIGRGFGFTVAVAVTIHPLTAL
jgi:hypothetical protein